MELDKKLGEGAFGEVHSGRLRLTDGSVVPVAVKLVSHFLHFIWKSLDMRIGNIDNL